ncbi:PAS domain-containing protein [Geodermatophilus sp. SYSU D00703]
MTETVVHGAGVASLPAGAWRRALDQMPDGAAIVDVDWGIRYANPAAAALLGRPAAEFTGCNLWIALPEAAGTIFHTCLLRARPAGAPVTWRAFYPPTGRWIDVSAHLADDLLHVSVRQDTARRAGPGGAATGTAAPEGGTPTGTGCGTWPRSASR